MRKRLADVDKDLKATQESVIKNFRNKESHCNFALPESNPPQNAKLKLKNHRTRQMAEEPANIGLKRALICWRWWFDRNEHSCPPDFEESLTMCEEE